MAKSENREKIKKKLLNKFRISVINEDTLEEKASFKLNRLNVILFGSLFSLFMIISTLLIIIYSPLRQYILGFSEADMRQKIVELTFKSDSLEQKLKASDLYFESIQKVLNGDIEVQKFNKDSLPVDNISQSLADIDIEPNEEELKLRQEVSEIEKYAIFDLNDNKRVKTLFFSPISGSLTSNFSPNNKHFGVDVLAKEGTAVKSIGDGSVIFSEYSVQTGFVIAIQHSNNFISIYKHNGGLTKRQGDFVKAGEVIATVGNTGEYSSGPHLHFELWNNGYPVDPFNYMNFK